MVFRLFLDIFLDNSLWADVVIFFFDFLTRFDPQLLNYVWEIHELWVVYVFWVFLTWHDIFSSKFLLADCIEKYVKVKNKYVFILMRILGIGQHIVLVRFSRLVYHNYLDLLYYLWIYEFLVMFSLSHG